MEKVWSHSVGDPLATCLRPVSQRFFWGNPAPGSGRFTLNQIYSLIFEVPKGVMPESFDAAAWPLSFLGAVKNGTLWMWYDVVHESSFYVFFVGRTCSNLSGHCWGLRGEWSYFVTWPKWRTQVTWIAILRLLLLKVIEGYWPPSQLDGCNLQCNHLIDLIPNLSFLPFMCPEVEFLYSLAWLDNVTGDGYPRTRGNCNRKPNTRHGNHGSTGLWLVSLQHSRFGRPWVLQPLESSTRRHRNSWKALPKKRRLGRFDGCFWWPVRWLFGGAQVVDLMLAAVEKAVALPAGTGMGSPGVLLRLILRNFSREKDETAEIEATV